MELEQLILWSAVVPGVAAGVVLLPAARSWRGAGSLGAGAVVPIALLAGLAAFWLGFLGVPEFPTSDANQWVAWSAVLAAAAGVGLAMRGGAPAWASWGARLLLSAGIVVLVSRNPAQLWSGGEEAGLLVAYTALIVALWTSLDSVTKRVPATVALGGMVVLAGGGAAVIMLAASAKLGMISGALAAALGATTVLAIWGRNRLDVRGAVPVVAVVVGTLWVNTQMLAGLPAGALVLLPLAPLLLAVPAVRSPARGALGSALMGAVMGAALTVPLIGAAAGWTYVATEASASADAAEASPAPPDATGYSEDDLYE